MPKIVDTYSCGVMNCGNGQCVHQLLDDACPCCGERMVGVKTNGLMFCSGCDYEDDSLMENEPGTWWTKVYGSKKREQGD